MKGPWEFGGTDEVGRENRETESDSTATSFQKLAVRWVTGQAYKLNGDKIHYQKSVTTMEFEYTHHQKSTTRFK